MTPQDKHLLVPEYVLLRALKALEDEHELYYGERRVAANLIRKELGWPAVKHHTKACNNGLLAAVKSILNCLK